MMSAPDGRYSASVASLIERIEPLGPGIGIVVVPSAQHAPIAAELAPRLGAQIGTLDQEIAPTQRPQRIVVAGLPVDGQAPKLLATLNGRRDFITVRNGFLILLVSSFELAHVQRYAPDLFSARLFLENVPFEPDTSVDAETARASLARYYDERFGRLDLRGFIRSEAEDVSFSVEEIFQNLQASLIRGEPLGENEAFSRELAVEEWLAATGHERPFVVLAHPGSGKTFLLRWLALAAAKRRPDVDLGVKDPLPLLVSLAAYAQASQSIGLLHYLTEMLLEAGQPAAHRVGRAADERQAVFLLDGMDEVGDEGARRRAMEGIRELHEQAPGCLIVITSRIAGYGSDGLDAHLLMLSAFDDERIRRFLVRWCELYAVSRLGGTDAVRSEGRQEGEQLASDVLGNPGVRALAGNPLLLTVLAIVHRAGVRLPDHRVELYAHATRVLVERWNRVRSLSGQSPAPPLKAVDAVRLLGPLALRMIDEGGSAVVTEEGLRAHIDRALAAGTLRGVTGADEVIALFRNALGLLVEQAPGIYAFLHLTLAEYFAAWELVRSDELDRIAADPTRAYQGQLREVLLLAAGELGVLRADDRRLDQFVETLVKSAGRRAGRPSPGVPSLLAGLLADDPHLTTEAAQRIVGELIPKWWFERSYGGRESLELVLEEAVKLVKNRLMVGRFKPLLHDSVKLAYGAGLSPHLFRNLARGGTRPLTYFLIFVARCGVDYGPHVEIYLSSGWPGPEAVRFMSHHLVLSPAGPNVVRGQFLMSRQLDHRVRSGALALRLEVNLHPSSEVLALPWTSARRIRRSGPAVVKLEINVPRKLSSGAEVIHADVSIVPAPATPLTPAPTRE